MNLSTLHLENGHQNSKFREAMGLTRNKSSTAEPEEEKKQETLTEDDDLYIHDTTAIYADLLKDEQRAQLNQKIRETRALLKQYEAELWNLENPLKKPKLSNFKNKDDTDDD